MGVCCLVRPLISCCGPQAESQSAPGPHLPVSVGSTPAPSSAHSARTLVHVQVHVHVHIRTALPTSFLFSFRVLVLVMGVLVDGPCPPASPLPCCPAASTAPCGVVKDWTAHPVCPPSPSPVGLQAGNLARGRDQPSSTPSLQPHRIILHPQGSASSDYKQTGGIHQLQPGPALSSLAPVYLHPSLPYHE